MRYGYLVVEGPHDVEFVGRLLRLFGFERIRLSADLAPQWEPLIKLSFPHDGDLTKRMPVPAFFQRPDYAIAVHSADGETRLVQTLQENLVILEPNLPLAQLSGIGLMLDADAQIAPDARWEKVLKLAKKLLPSLPLPGEPGEVSSPPSGLPRCGGFVFPDNENAGTLETLLLACGEQVYPSLYRDAVAYIDKLDTRDPAFGSDDLKQLNKPAGRAKAIVSTMASVLRPGKSIAVTIADSRLLAGPALALPRVQAVCEFLRVLLDL